MYREKQLTKSAAQGFTLIELILTVAILAILSALAVPFYSNYRNNSFNATALSDAKAGRIALEGYFQEFHQYP